MTAVAWRTSAGAAARIPVARATNLTRTLQDWADRGLRVIGLDAGGDTTLDDLDGSDPLVVVVGSEGKGLSRLVRQNCDEVVSIPMAGSAESLNASVAAGWCWPRSPGSAGVEFPGLAVGGGGGGGAADGGAAVGGAGVWAAGDL